MLAFVWRQLKRIGLLIPGLAVAYVAVRGIFPVLDNFLRFDPLAIIVTYIVVAYGLIPATIRLWHLVYKPSHIPLYCTTPDGFASDPINIGVVGTRDELIGAMTSAGWHQADRYSPSNIFKMVVSIAFRRPYKTAPFSALFLFGRTQDIGFQLPYKTTALKRHHVRFWASTYTTDKRYRDHVYFWQKKHRATTPDRILWVGAVSRDIGVGLIRHNAQLTHNIHPDTNAERRFLVDNLKKTGLVQKQRTINIGKPYRIRNRVIMSYMNADGKMTICELIVDD